MIEVVGILATILVLISFLFNDIKKIRIINIIGCILFVIYGLIINSFSVWFLNGALLIIHVIKLLKENKNG